MSAGADDAPQLTRALHALRQLRARLDAVESARVEPIAVVGLSCRFPGGADSGASFWRLLLEGRDGITEVPADRWDADALFDADADAVGRIATRWGGFLDGIREFDAPFFGISPREATELDPQQRLLLEVAWEALEHAGQPADGLARSATGVFVGVHSHSSDYALLQMRDVDDVGTYTSTGTAHSILANRLSYWLDLRGPSLAVDTACSSSLVAVHLAVQSLRAGECDMALAAGVNLLLSPEVTAALSRMRMLAADGRCKPFDSRADGFVRGEGCGVVVLKRLRDAVAARDPILAVIAGSAVNQDGATNGLTAPSGLAQQEVVRRALEDARTDPSVIGFVETHGTGTALGDPIEVEALAAVLGAGDTPCLLGSVKGNIGHLEGAAGIAGLIKAVLALQHATIPPNLHFHELNPHITLGGTRFEIATSPRRWTGGTVRHAGVSSFGFGGTNAHVVLREASAVAAARVPTAVERRTHLLPISAQTPAALRAHAADWARLLAGGTLSLDDACHTAARRRTQHEHRLAVVGRSADEMAAALSAFLRGDGPTAGRADPERRRRMVWVFPGQGAQWPGMGVSLMDREPVFLAALEECDRLFRPLSGWSLLAEISAPAECSRLDETEVTQPATCAVQIALAALWRSWGIAPDAVIGHSAGEVAAAHVAGVLSLDDAMRIVHHRGRIMRGARAGRMAAVGLPRKEVEALVARADGAVSLAAVNGPASCVISGDAAAIDAALAELEARGAFARMLPVSLASHSPHMDPLRAELVEALAGLAPRSAAMPLYSTVSGDTAREGDYDARYWGRNLREPVLFADALAAAGGAGTTDYLEISPHPILRTPIEQCAGAAAGLILGSLQRDEPDEVALLRSLGALHAAGVTVDWTALYPAGNVVPLPSYPWQRSRYWLDVSARRTAARQQDDDVPPPGRRIVSPAIRGVVFESRISAPLLAGLGEHRIGSAAVVPAAWFIELALAAGEAVMPHGECVVETLDIVHPLALPHDGVRLVHTIVQPAADGRTPWELHSRAEDDDGWVLHATGTLVAGTAAAAVTDSDMPRHVTELQYGSGAAASVPRRAVLLDQCLRSAASTLDSAVREQRFIVAGVHGLRMRGNVGGRLHCHVWRIEDSIPAVGLRILNVNGECVADIERIRFAPIQVDAGTGTPSSGWNYEVAWRPRTLFGQRARNESAVNAAELVAACGATARPEPHPDAVSAGVLDEVSAAYVVRALQRLGVHLVAGARLAEADVLRIAGASAHRRLLRRMLGMLCEDGILQEEQGGWRVVRNPGVPDLDAAIRGLLEQWPGHGSELKTFRRCAAALADVLSGRQDALQLFFADDAIADTERLYRDGAVARETNERVAAAVAHAVSALPRHRTLRVLEIGAGTGGTTVHVLPLLPPDRTEYVFTDVSRAFLDRAAARLDDQPFVRFEVLDIECEPLEQGFADGHFDVVIAANVLHATSNVAESLARVRRLLAPGGLLLLAEGVRPARWIELVFGLLDGWWKFADAARRGSQPLLSGEQWVEVLRANGFASAHAARVAGVGPATFDQAVIVAAADTAVNRVQDTVQGDGGVTLSPVADAVLVLAADAEPAGQLAQHVRAVGGECMVAVCEATTRPCDDVVREWLSARGTAGGAVVYFAGTAEGDASAPQPRVQAGCMELAAITRALVEAADAAPARLWIVTRGAQPVMPGEDPDPAQAALWGFGRSIALEAPRHWGGLIDLPVDAEPDRDAARIIAQLRAGDGEDQVALRGVARLVPRLTPITSGDRAQPAFDVTSAYLITGGAGDLGLALAQWLATHGARTLVLTARTKLPDRAAWPTLEPTSRAARQVQAIRGIEAAGARVVSVAADVCDPVGMRALVARFGHDLPPLRGVFHTAAVMEFDPIARMTQVQLEAVLRAKVAGAWLLHEITRELSLDHFVMFASVAGVWGSRGMAHYAAGNQFLDALAHHRRARGLPALTIDWGGWAGGDAERAANRFLADSDFQLMAPTQALHALGVAMTAGVAQRTVAAADWAALRASYCAGGARRFFNELGVATMAAAEARVAAGRAGLLRQVDAADAEQSVTLLTDFVRGEVAAVLGLEADRLLEPGQGFFRLGMDSLMTVDLRRRLEHALGVSLPATIAFEYPTVESLAAHLAGLVLGDRDRGAAAPPLHAVATGAWAVEADVLDAMSESELAAMLDGAVADLLDEGKAAP
jgi:acyl transferase domain-containing protein/SAM-dependent methyltransferase/NAD(P)-dependent dehydrogenase (short-subunit alcohol dehydrogenase family)/acyl carrier protein